MSEILVLSIKPKYSQMIFDGTKNLEIRKRMVRRDVSRVLVYETMPTGMFVGSFRFRGCFRISDTVAHFRNTGLSLKDIRDYMGGSIGFGIEIGDPVRFKKPFAPDPLITIRPPQSFTYITEEWYKGLMVHTGNPSAI